MTASSSRKKLKKLGKAQAREQFAPLIEALSTGGGVVEVTDYGEVVAVMLSYGDYLQLVAQAGEPLKPKRQLAGSAVLVGDLAAASRKISESMLESIDKTAHDL